VFRAITHFANPALEAAQASAPVTVIADPATCSLQFNPVGTASFTSPCDVAKAALVRRGVPYSGQRSALSVQGVEATVRVGDVSIESYDAVASNVAERKAVFDAALAAALDAAGYPLSADPARVNKVMLVLLLTYLVVLVTMVYGPIAAALVEMFPTRIRYTSMSLPYHIGNGWFGGFLPTTAFAIVAATGNIYSGLWYPVGIAVMTFVIGSLFLRETKHVDIREFHS